MLVVRDGQGGEFTGGGGEFHVAVLDMAPARAAPGDDLLDRYAAEAGGALDRLSAERPRLPVALHGIGIGALVATALAMARPEVKALVLERPVRLVGRLERLLLLRERLRKGSDIPSMAMRAAGTDMVGNWLALAALQQALLRSAVSPVRADLPVLMIGRSADCGWLGDFLRRRGMSGIDVVEEAAGEEAAVWLRRVLA